MTTTPTHAAANTTTGLILAIDLGKFKTVACAYDRGPAQAHFDPQLLGQPLPDAGERRPRQ